jgi:hypothetical protein
MPSATSLRVCSRWARRACRLTHRRKAADAYGRRMQHRTQGQAVVEFCLVAMLFFTLLFAIFDFGMLLNDWISVTTGASVGARQAAVGACLGWQDGTRSGCPSGEHSVVEAVRESVPLLAVTVPTWVGLVDWTNGCGATSCTAYCRPYPATQGWHVAQEPSDQYPPPTSRRWAICAAEATADYDDPTDSDRTPGQQINDTLTVVVRAQLELPVPLPGLPTDTYAESSSTVRFEGDYVQ